MAVNTYFLNVATPRPYACTDKPAPPPLWEGLAYEQMNVLVAIVSLWILLTANRWQ